MCGIVGIARPGDAPPVTPFEIGRMCQAIYHRGPDDEGMHVQGNVGIGMRRLSIIDLTGGHQPIYNEDGTKAVVQNGEIYNYRELNRLLAARGHQFRTNSDTETIVHLYEEYGVDCVKHLRGMFAFALWDDTKRTLLVARDRFGIKPLYYSVRDGQLAFASEMKALLATDLGDVELDWNAFEAFFRLGYIPAPFSPYQNVRKLPPGHVLIWQDGAIEERPYWDVPASVPEHDASPADVLAWLDESVSAHLVSDVPMAVLLSGGLDSSAVFTSMALAGATPHAFTARYLGSGSEAADESGLAAELVQRYGGKLTVVDIEPRVTDIFEQTVHSLDEPHADESSIPTWALSQRVAAEYKVVLAGTGGDELFGGYRRHLGLLASSWYTALPTPARAVISSAVSVLPEPRNGQLSVHRLKRFVRASPGGIADRYYDMLNKQPDMKALSFLAPEIRNQFGSASPAANHVRAVHAAGGSPQGLKAALYMDYKTYLPDDILHLSDRIAMAHSLEVRVPMVDHLLVERIFPLSDRLKIGRGKPKQLLRRALASRLPASYFTAKKRGFVGPTALWLRNEMREMVQDELSPERLKRIGFFDTNAVSQIVDEHMTRRHNRESALWSLLSFVVWHRVFVEQNTPVSSR